MVRGENRLEAHMEIKIRDRNRVEVERVATVRRSVAALHPSYYNLLHAWTMINRF